MKLLVEDLVLGDPKVLNSEKVWAVVGKDLKRLKAHDLNTEEVLTKAYNNIADAEVKLRFIYTTLANHTNRDAFKNILSSVVTSVLRDGFDVGSNKFLQFVTNPAMRDIKIPSECADLIEELIAKDKLDIDNVSWLYSPELYSGDLSDVMYKIKALAFISDSSNTRGFDMNGLTVNKLATMSADEIRTAFKTITKEQLDGAEYVAKKLGIEPEAVTTAEIKKYIEQSDVLKEYNKNQMKFIQQDVILGSKYNNKLKKIAKEFYDNQEDFEDDLNQVLLDAVTLHRSTRRNTAQTALKDQRKQEGRVDDAGNKVQ